MLITFSTRLDFKSQATNHQCVKKNTAPKTKKDNP